MSFALVTPNPFATPQLAYLTLAPPNTQNIYGLQNLAGCQSDLSLIEQGEGFRSCMYKDTMGIKTICYGFNLERGSTAKSMVEKVGGNYDDLMNGGCLSEPQCSKLLDMDMSSARSCISISKKS